ncbi:hypothetical protein B0J13DRAFT_645583 [Dactylonectria estremocensis]|uniref:GH18 domain-containing protein n=1 Tax=Dactylonectria estremocensis TaxID=1079267 RepID=A0A9P9E2L1_9HYPO|nr:hypothetical protein B0J13DRAFT_645583 [Dactylonectria estremocensis]
MTASPWPSRFVGAHMYLPEPGKQGDSWDNIPNPWKEIRFDAVDVLFISPFFVNEIDHSLMLSTGDDGETSLGGRFEWAIRAARSKNPSIKIILEQFYGSCKGGSDYSIIKDSHAVNQYADSVSNFIETYYNRTLPTLDGSGEVSARIDGLDIDVEGGNSSDFLPSILTAVRASLDELSYRLSATRLTVSICPAWPGGLDSSIAQSCDYVNMQNYSGGEGLDPSVFLQAIPGLSEQRQLAWGFASETPNKNTAETFIDVKARAQDVVNGRFPGTYNWRLNSGNYAFENVFQVWLFNFVHGASLPDAKPEDIVAKGWEEDGGN